MAIAPSLQAALDQLRTDLSSIFGERLQSLVLYGPHARGDEPGTKVPANTLALVDRVTCADLDACAGRAARWARAGLGMPLLLGAAEFTRSLDAFPIEYGNIIAHHVVLSGADPFAAASIHTADLRRACEIQAKSHLIHLREGYLEAGANPAAIAALVLSSARPFLALLANVLRLLERPADSAADLAANVEAIGDISPELVRRIASLTERNTLQGPEARELFPQCLAASERLAEFADTWTGRGQP